MRWNWLRDAVADCYEQKAAALVKDVWAARNDYIQVLLDRSGESWARFQCRHGLRVLSLAEENTLAQLLELERHAMLMFTSCGWFFDDLSGIETRQVIGHAARVVELAEALFHKNLESGLLERLELAKSNIPEHGNGRTMYEKLVQGRRGASHRAGTERDREHWLDALVNDLTEQFRVSGEMTFETMERVLQQHKEAYRRDQETARRMYRTYPQLFEDNRETLKSRAAGM